VAVYVVSSSTLCITISTAWHHKVECDYSSKI
jgi:hypothetical protein